MADRDGRLAARRLQYFDLHSWMRRMIFQPIGEPLIIPTRLRLRCVFNHRLAEAGGLAHHLVLMDDHGQHLPRELPTQGRKKISRKRRIGVVQRGNQMTSNRPAYTFYQLTNRSELLVGAADGEEPCLHGNQRLRRRAKGVEGQQANRRRAVDHASIVSVPKPAKHPGEAPVAVGQLVQSASWGLQAGQPHGAGDQVKVAGDFPHQ